MSEQPVAETPANETRGEITLALEGRDYVLRPSYTAIAAFEAATGKGMMALYGLAASGTMSVADAARIVTHCIRAQGDATGDRFLQVSERRVGEMIVEAEGGMMFVLIRLQRLLLNAASGAYTAKGEAKAATGTDAIPDAA